MGDRIWDMMMEGIEIHFDKDEGHLRLDCGDEEFSHIRDLVVSEASASGELNPCIDGIRSIVVRRTTALGDTTPGPFRRGLGSYLIVLALAIALGIQIIGIITVVRWLLGRGA
jgi:hypothetical protein